MNNVQKNNFKDFKICDSHMHLAYPETVDATEKTFREIMEYFCFDRIALMCLTTGSSYRKSDAAGNLKALYIKDKFNRKRADSTFVYGSPMHFFDERDTAENYLNQVKTLYNMGVDGYKFLDGKPSLRKKLGRKLCDPIYDKMYAFIEEKGLPVKMHVADPPTFWGAKETMSEAALTHGWWVGDGTYPSFEELHEEVYSILKKFPKLKFCPAHCFYLGHRIDELTAFFENWENTAFDLTPGYFNLYEFSKKPDEWRAFFKKYAHRIFFGTDIFNETVEGSSLSKYDDIWKAPTDLRRFLEKKSSDVFDAALGALAPLGLDDDTLSEIYFGSHLKLHPHAEKLDKELIVFEAKKLVEDIAARNVTYENESDYALETANSNKIINHFSK